MEYKKYWEGKTKYITMQLNYNLIIFIKKQSYKHTLYIILSTTSQCNLVDQWNMNRHNYVYNLSAEQVHVQ